jgi:hypothetical protein
MSEANARRIIALIEEGGAGKITLHFRNREITGIERADTWPEVAYSNATRTYLPSATGVMLTGGRR